MERIVGHQLHETQQFTVSVMNRGLNTPGPTIDETPPDEPDHWKNDEGLTAAEVDALDSEIRQRANLTRHFEEIMTPVLHDTDTLSESVKLRHALVVNHALADTRQVGRLTFSAFSRYEVLRGFKRRGVTTQLARYDAFCDESDILPVTDSI